LAVVFTTHSVPMSMAQRSGTTADGALYVAQHLAACAAVADLVTARLGTEFAWQLAYQSRSGSPTVPWLEPDVNDVLRGLAADGRRGVIVVPIGFVSDHVEVIWDLDTEAARTASRAGLWFRRIGTPGTDPRFVAALADLIVERLDPTRRPVPSVTGLASRPDFCPPGCCRGATTRPTTAGADSADDWAGSATGGAPDLDRALLAGSGLVPAVGE
jgi:ferrochelatase